jgi:hypothetical protein
LATKSKSKKKKRKMRVFKAPHATKSLTALQRLTAHRYYELASCMLILLNAFILGQQTQYMAELNRDNARDGIAIESAPVSYRAVHIFFCFAFTVDLGLRWIADGFAEFFKTEEAAWNLFDVAIVGSSLVEVIADVIADQMEGGKNRMLNNISVLRVLRIIRLVRVARAIRVMRFFRELRMMIFAICGCMKNLLWVILILTLTFYMFGVGFTSAVVDHLDTIHKWNDESNAPLIESFGTVDRSILSLFMSMSGGNDWSAYYDALGPLPAYYHYAFLLFICFSIFAVVNIVTGVFVESALQANMKDKDIVVQEELQAKKVYLESMAELFEEMDEDGRGTITVKEFEHKLQDENVIAYFNALKLDVSDARTLFQLLDYDHSDEVGMDEFLDGCYGLQGESRSLDMKIMQYEVQYLKERIDVQSESLERIKHALGVVEIPS